MTSPTSSLSASIGRYQNVIAFVAGLATVCTIYYFSNITSALDESSSKNVKDGLHRSNAIRHPRRLRPINTQVPHLEPDAEDDCPISPNSLGSSFYYGDFATTKPNGERLDIPMVNGDLPSPANISSRHNVPYAEAARLREDLEKAFLDAFFARTMPPGDIVRISERSRQHIISELGLFGNYHPENIIASLDRYSRGELDNNPNRLERQRHQHEDAASIAIDAEEEGRLPTEDHRVGSQPTGSSAATEPLPERALPSFQETIHDGSESEQSSQATGFNISKKGQSLLGLIYTIAEEQAKKEGYVHRGVTCNSCNTIPIRGIRYRCANCVDYDLCEQCEALQMHSRTHLFYKVRIPAPFLGNPRQPQPVWYPGKPSSVMYPLSKEDKTKFSETSGFQLPQIEALWEQFRCLAATEWASDPVHYHMAIDRRTFDRCFIPKSMTRPPPPNLIYDRVFSFYDTNGDGLIGFEEFLLGIACLQNKGKGDRLRRTFDGYDMDRNGFVDRKDFLRMFKALFHLHRELAKDIVARLHDDEYDDDDARNVVSSNQAISSAFAGVIPPGEASRTGEGKTLNEFGDYVINGEWVPTIWETPTDEEEPKSSSPSIRFPSAEEDHGQEVLYHIIQDSINELIDPLFRMREDLALEVVRTTSDRTRYADEIAHFIDAGFWRQMEQLLLRLEHQWRTSPPKIVYNVTRTNMYEQEARGLLQCLKASEQFKKFDPADVARHGPSSEQNGALSARSDPDRSTSLSTPEFLAMSADGDRAQVQSEDIVPLVDLSHRDLFFIEADFGINANEGRELMIDDELEHARLQRRALRSDSDRVRDDAIHAGLLRRRALSDESEATTANLIFDDSEWDITINAESKEQLDDSTSDADADSGTRNCSVHELSRLDRPIDATLPQNRPNAVRTSLEDDSLESGVGSSMLSPAPIRSSTRLLDPPSSTPTAEQRDPTLPQHRPNTVSTSPETQPNTTSVPSPTPIPSPAPTLSSPPHRPSSPSATADPISQPVPPPANGASPTKPPRRHLRHGSMSKLRPRTPPPLERLKELALLEMLKARDERRGGWGRIGWEEFEAIMKGPKGQSLGFVGQWVEMAIF